MKFEDALEIIFQHEGGYVRHPNDPGGETNFGISKRSYPQLNIRDLTKEEAAEIYRRDFWDKCQCDLLPPALRLSLFDAAINQGPARAVGFLQASVGATVDGVLGPETFAKVSQFNADRVLQKFAFHRLQAYWKNPNFKHFGFGWVKRLLDVSLKSGVGEKRT